VETNPKTDKPADMEDPPRILTAEVPWNPFDDIEIRQDVLQKNLKKTKLQGDAMRERQAEEEGYGAGGRKNKGSGVGGGRRMGGGGGGDFEGMEAVKKVKKKQILSFGNDSDEDGDGDDDEDAGGASKNQRAGRGMFAQLKEKKKKKKKKKGDGDSKDDDDSDAEDDIEAKRKKLLEEMTGGRTGVDGKKDSKDNDKVKKKARGWDDIDDDGDNDDGGRSKKKRRVDSGSSEDSGDDSDRAGGGRGSEKKSEKFNDDPEEAERKKRERMYENLKKSIVGVGKGDEDKKKNKKKRHDNVDSDSDNEDSLDKDGNRIEDRPLKKKKIKGVMNDLLKGYKTKKVLGSQIRQQVVEKRGELREEDLQKAKDEKYLAKMRKFEDRLKSQKSKVKNRGSTDGSGSNPNSLDNPNNANTAQNNLLFPNHAVAPVAPVTSGGDNSKTAENNPFGRNKTIFSDQDPLETIMAQYGGREEFGDGDGDGDDKAIEEFGLNEKFGLTGGLNFHVSSDRAFQMAEDKEMMKEREKEGFSKDVVGEKVEVKKSWYHTELGGEKGGKGGFGGGGGKGKGKGGGGKKGRSRSPRR